MWRVLAGRWRTGHCYRQAWTVNPCRGGQCKSGSCVLWALRCDLDAGWRLGQVLGLERTWPAGNRRRRQPRGRGGRDGKPPPPPPAGATLLCRDRVARALETDVGNGSADRGLGGLAGGPPLREPQRGGGGGDCCWKTTQLRTAGTGCSTFEGCCGLVGPSFGDGSAQRGEGGEWGGCWRWQGCCGVVGLIFSGGSAQR